MGAVRLALVAAMVLSAAACTEEGRTSMGIPDGCACAKVDGNVDPASCESGCCASGSTCDAESVCKTNMLIAAIVVILLCCACGGGAYFIYNQSNKKAKNKFAEEEARKEAASDTYGIQDDNTYGGAAPAQYGETYGGAVQAYGAGETAYGGGGGETTYGGGGGESAYGGDTPYGNPGGGAAAGGDADVYGGEEDAYGAPSDNYSMAGVTKPRVARKSSVL